MNSTGENKALMPGSPEWLENVFTYHPASPGQSEKYVAVRSAAKELVKTIIDNCPSSADRSTAIRQVRESVMTANASIALNGLV